MTDLIPNPAPVPRETGWSLALLRQLDWRRMQELVTILLHRAGFCAEVAWVRPDGGVVLSVSTAKRRGRTEALVQCAAWARMNVDSGALQELYNSLLREGASRGIFITAGEFSADAREFVRTKPVELIDGASILRTILRMPEEEQSYHLKMMTVGPYTVPTCPACGKKLELRDDTAFDPKVQPKDVTYRERQLVGTEIYCRTLTVKAGAEVQFMKPVWAHDMAVHGRAHGNITLQGRLTVGRGGVLTGLVAARTIKMDEGGVLEAEARILNESDVQPVRAMPVHQVWRCSRWPKCRGQLPLR